MIYILLYLSCVGINCTPVFGEIKENPTQCFEQMARMPERKDYKVMCIPVMDYEGKYYLK